MTIQESAVAAAKNDSTPMPKELNTWRRSSIIPSQARIIEPSAPRSAKPPPQTVMNVVTQTQWTCAPMDTKTRM